MANAPGCVAFEHQTGRKIRVQQGGWIAPCVGAWDVCTEKGEDCDGQSMWIHCAGSARYEIGNIQKGGHCDLWR